MGTRLFSIASDAENRLTCPVNGGDSHVSSIQEFPFLLHNYDCARNQTYGSTAGSQQRRLGSRASEPARQLKSRRSDLNR
jgi:hypothetical protein